MSRRLFSTLFFLLVAAVLLFSDKGHISGDGQVRFETLVTLVEDGRLSPQLYSIVQPLLAAPLYGLGALEAATTAAAPDTEPETPRERRIAAALRFVARFNKLVALFVCLVVFRIARDVLTFSDVQAALTATGVLFASLLAPHARDFYSEPLWTLLALAVLLLASREPFERTHGFLIAALLALAVPLNPVLLAALGAIFGLPLLRPASHPQARPLASWGIGGLSLGLLLFFVENLVRRGSPLRTGYEGSGFTTPLLTGLAGQLAAPARGIVFFLPCWVVGPVLATWFRRRLPASSRRFVDLSLLFSGVLLLVYAKWFAWHGATYWGPRFLLPLSVLGVLYVALLLQAGGASAGVRAVAVLLLVDSFLIRKVGVAVGHGALSACLDSAADPERCYWSFDFSPAASLLSPGGRALLLGDRSTAVELGALALFGLLLWAGRNSAALRKTSGIAED